MLASHIAELEKDECKQAQTEFSSLKTVATNVTSTIAHHEINSGKNRYRDIPGL